MNPNVGKVVPAGVISLVLVVASSFVRMNHDTSAVKPAEAKRVRVALDPLPGEKNEPAENVEKRDGPEKKEPAAEKPVKKELAASRIIAARGPAVLRRWEVTPPPPPKADQSPSYERYFVRELAVNDAGMKVVTRTTLEAATWDLRTGTRLHTFKAASKIIPHKPPEGPEFVLQEEVSISPDGRFVALYPRSMKYVTLYNAETGKQLVKYRAPAGTDRFLDRFPPAFTPEGEYFLFCANDTKNRDVIAALATRTGTMKPLALPTEWGKQSSQMWAVLAALPRQGVLIRHVPYVANTPGQTWVYAMELKTGKERGVKSVDFEPFSLFENRGIKVSPDGRYLSARGTKCLIVCDWKADRRLSLLTASDPSSLNEWFTPDAQRVASHRVTDWYRFKGGQRLTPYGGWLTLYDVVTGKEVGEFVMEKHDMNSLSTVAFTRDGQTMVAADRRTQVVVVNFEQGFGVAPLPPAPRPEGRETLPLR